MERQEFFLLIPAIIIGVAVVELLKIFSHKKSYSEVVAWGCFIMFYIIIIWLELYAQLEDIANNKWFFVLIIIQSIILSRIAAIITPEEKDADTKSYFMSVRVPFYLLTTLLGVYNVLLHTLVFDCHQPLVFSVIGIILLLSCAIFDKPWLRWFTWPIVVVFGVITLVKL